MKKNLIILASVLILGIVAGVWLCSELHPAIRNAEPQKDTVVVQKIVGYTSLKLKVNTIKLDIPKLSTMAMVFIPYDSTKIVYKDRVQYIAAEREFFYTKTDKAEIWHSGIDSTIDSLNVVENVVSITNTPRPNKNTISLGIDASYCNTLSIPIYLEYERMLQKNIGIHGQLFYDLRIRQFGVLLGTSIQFGW